jgi:transposase
VILVGAMSNEGLIATMTLPGGMNTASFLVYLERILLPQLWKEAIIVMDNLPVHHAKTVETLIKFFGVNVKFLPPYSPDLSPIELCWSRIKGIMRSEAARSSETLDAAITKAINGITDENALHGFNHCSLFLEPIR